MKYRCSRWTTLASLLATVIIVGGIGYYAGLFGAAEKPDAAAGGEAEVKGTATVTTTDAQQGSLSPTALAYGTVVSSPQNSFVIQIPRDGVFKTVNVRDGDVVRAGEPIVTVVTAAANTTAYEQAKSDHGFRNARRSACWRTCSRNASPRMIRSQPRAKRWKMRKSSWTRRTKIGAGAGEANHSRAVRWRRHRIDGSSRRQGAGEQHNCHDRQPLQPDGPAESRTRRCGETGARAPVKLTNTFGGDAIDGKIRTIGATVDPTTHLVKALCDVPPAAGAHLALGATLVAHIELPAKQGILVPRSALLEDSTGPYIFTICRRDCAQAERESAGGDR